MELPVLIDTLRDALEHDQTEQLIDKLEDVHPADYAAAISNFSSPD